MDLIIFLLGLLAIIVFILAGEAVVDRWSQRRYKSKHRPRYDRLEGFFDEFDPNR